MKEGRDRPHLLSEPDDDAVEQMISSAGEESTAGKGDGLERAGVVASLIYDGFEYVDRDDMVIERHRMGGVCCAWDCIGSRSTLCERTQGRTFVPIEQHRRCRSCIFRSLSFGLS